MSSTHMPKLTATLLRSYSEAALCNADELLVEASLLYEHGHNARAYFLAVSCIEEAGKALLAFDAQNRNLSDPAVCTRLKADMESHGRKINYALGSWALSSPDQRAALKMALDLIFHLKNGREPSMYCDLRKDPDRVQTPQRVVRVKTARDCVSLARKTLIHSRRYLSENPPPMFTISQDRLFTMKFRKFQEMLQIEDFWWYYISRIEAGEQDIAEAVLGYQRDHIKTGMPFRTRQ